MKMHLNYDKIAKIKPTKKKRLRFYMQFIDFHFKQYTLLEIYYTAFKNIFLNTVETLFFFFKSFFTFWIFNLRIIKKYYVIFIFSKQILIK